ncbi:LysE family translocator [Prosthecodimorpha staleyi]|uniref:LysE family translocator n=1 Tax=Prosthecodimorpha staleyi TaxID=2840188 RepID=A0A947D8C1_9HYPH|nr:LysE family translocator [Prosthecodimorpha staleyi]MBT9291954.1 LysE family translocator [Prosthecodimorpha staleyi]
MTLELYLAFVAATVVLILIPGPNVALIVANALAYGWRYGLVTVAGTSSAMVLQLALTVAGMTALVAAMAGLFDVLRWAGAAYLVYLGIRAWRAPPADLARTRAEPKSVRAIWLRGFLVSMTNPKTLIFYGAFLPQFVAEGADPGGQLVLLAATFLVLAVVLDGVWALLADRFRAVLALKGRLTNRITGILLVGAGAGLALARRS